MANKEADLTVIGGGIVGMAAAMSLSHSWRLSVQVVEAEDHLAAHQTGHNSGVIHSGLYYKPGSLKAQNCVEGRESMYRFCQEYGIPYERCGKVVVATSAQEIPQLRELEKRGRANGLAGLRWLDQAELREYEPHVAGVAGLHVPQTGIVDYVAVVGEYGRQLVASGGTVYTGHQVQRVTQSSGEFILHTSQGEVRSRFLINCAGLQCDRVARLCGLNPGVQIIPFRGEYYELVPQRQHLVKNLIYPVPDPRFPFLGVHFTRMVGGGIEAGPNAVLAFRREGYRFWSFSFRDVFDLLRYSGFWHMCGRYWKMGLEEFRRSLSKNAFVRSLRRLIPELRDADVHPSGAGVRAQAVEGDGKLVDDFRILESERMIHVLNAPSPAATASLSIGKTIAAMAARNFGLHLRSENHT